jgi:hypothetical protein
MFNSELSPLMVLAFLAVVGAIWESFRLLDQHQQRRLGSVEACESSQEQESPQHRGRKT